MACVFILLTIFVLVKAKQAPNIIFILADDYGYNDIGYHGSEINTPVLDKLANEGVKLENYYVQPICTPTRSTLLTGRYQIHTGLQHGIIWPAQPNCVPLEDVTIAQKLKEQGYKTHVVGKWHNGFYKKECTPTSRGFDSFFGYLTGGEDYYSHNAAPGYPGKEPFSRWEYYDLRRNEDVSTKEKGVYSTFAFTKEAQEIVKKHDRTSPLFLYLAYQAVHSPMEVPAHYQQPYKHIKDRYRQIYAGMTSAMDEGIGNLTDTLKEAGLYENAIIIFSTDNGGQVYGGGNNWPLRGWKGSLWEGGIRGVGFVNSPLLDKPGRISNDMIHVSDWFPTLVNLAGGDLNGTRPLDGFNVWSSISDGEVSPRTEILHNIDPIDTYWDSEVTNYKWCHQAAIRVGDWKLLTGCPGDPRWIPPPSAPEIVNASAYNQYINEDQIYLFNIAEDPEERVELSQKYPFKVLQLLSRLEEYNNTAVPVVYPDPDLQANPALHDDVWSPWQDDNNL